MDMLKRLSCVRPAERTHIDIQCVLNAFTPDLFCCTSFRHNHAATLTSNHVASYCQFLLLESLVAFGTSQYPILSTIPSPRRGDSRKRGDKPHSIDWQIIDRLSHGCTRAIECVSRIYGSTEFAS